MIVLLRGYGGHSNRLLQNLHLEAFCLEHGIRFANPALSDICRYYVSPVRSDMRAAAWVARAALRLRQRGWLARVITFEKDVDNAELLLARGEGRVLYVEGWAFRARALTKKYQEHFAAKYSLKPEYYSGNSTLERIISVNRDQRAVVAVHIRRGDYKSWRDGVFYFEDNVYERYMDGMAEVIKTQLGKETVFVICSDAKTSFVDSARVIVSENPWYLDHHLMSRCDYIIGPPSTFTTWASYVGRTRLFIFRDASGEIDVRRFRYSSG